MASWFNNGANNLKKTQYYVWFLGSKECHGLRGREYVLPAAHKMFRETEETAPNKVTIQISSKGLKLIQTIPTINKSGKLKMETMKFEIPSHSVTFSMICPPPYSDVVAAILLVFNPETRCPIHVHCYRCDSPETAIVMHSSMQQLIGRPENQKRLGELERRLVASGLLHPPRQRIASEQQPRAQITLNPRPDAHRHDAAGFANRNTRPLPAVSRRVSSFKDTSDSNVPPERDNWHRRNASGRDFQQARSHEMQQRIFSSPLHHDDNVADYEDFSDDFEDDVHLDADYVEREADRVARLHIVLQDELKTKLKSKPPILYPPKDYLKTLRKGPAKLALPDYENRRSTNIRIIGRTRESPTTSSGSSGRPSFANHHNNGGFWKKFNRSHNLTHNGHLGQQIRATSTNALDEGALTSSTSGFGSDLSGSGGRYRFSVADLPSQFNNTERDMFDESDASFRFHRQPPSRFISTDNLANSTADPFPLRESQEAKRLRAFGDTFKFVKKPVDTVNLPNHQNKRGVQGHIGAENWITEKKRQYRSLDNLHVQTDFSPEPHRSQNVHNRAFGRPVTGPFGNRYQQSANVDGFWRERAKRASWYIAS